MPIDWMMNFDSQLSCGVVEDETHGTCLRIMNYLTNDVCYVTMDQLPDLLDYIRSSFDIVNTTEDNDNG